MVTSSAGRRWTELRVDIVGHVGIITMTQLVVQRITTWGSAWKLATVDMEQGTRTRNPAVIVSLGTINWDRYVWRPTGIFVKNVGRVACDVYAAKLLQSSSRSVNVELGACRVCM